MMRQRFIKWVFILVALIPAVLLAQWDTSLFDGESERWGYGYERAQQCYSAVVERVGEDCQTTPRRWGSSWTLKEAKSDIAGSLQSRDWVNTAEKDATWFSSGTNDFPYLNKSNILVNAGAPTNWFDVDPHWGVVTHSNGWKYLDDVLNEMTELKTTAGWTNKQTKSGEVPYNWCGERWWVDESNTWNYTTNLGVDCFKEGWKSGAVSAAQDALAESSTGSGSMEIWSDGRATYFAYEADGSQQHRWWGLSGRTARGKISVKNNMRVSADVEVWLAGDVGATYDTSPDDSVVYDDFEIGVSKNYTFYCTVDNVAASQTAISGWVQTSGGLDDLPKWVEDPMHDEVGHDYGDFYFETHKWRGIIFEKPIATLDFDTPNGFKYVEQP